MMMRISTPTVSSSRMGARTNKTSTVVAPRRVAMRATDEINYSQQDLASSGKTPKSAESEGAKSAGSYAEELSTGVKDTLSGKAQEAGNTVKQAGQNVKEGIADAVDNFPDGDAPENFSEAVKGGVHKNPDQA